MGTDDDDLSSTTASATAAAAPSSLMRSQKVLSWLMILNAVTPLASVPLYFCLPFGTVKFWGGSSDNAHAAFWCQIVAAGDLLVAYLWFTALRSNFNGCGEVRRVIIRGQGLYCLFHFLAFGRASLPRFLSAFDTNGGVLSAAQFPVLPAAMSGQIWFALAMSMVITLYYGFVVNKRDLEFDSGAAFPHVCRCRGVCGREAATKQN